MNNQKGFSAVKLLIVVLIVAVAGVGGYFILKKVAMDSIPKDNMMLPYVYDGGGAGGAASPSSGATTFDQQIAAQVGNYSLYKDTREVIIPYVADDQADAKTVAAVKDFDAKIAAGYRKTLTINGYTLMIIPNFGHYSIGNWPLQDVTSSLILQNTVLKFYPDKMVWEYGSGCQHQDIGTPGYAAFSLCVKTMIAARNYFGWTQ